MADADDETQEMVLEPAVRLTPSSPPIGEGHMIAGHYRVVRPLGSGGMGLVVLARDTSLEREVAIKLIRPDLVAHPSAGNDFLAEARAMARLVHPNVVGIHAVGELEGAPYLVMEYIPGQSLQARLADRPGPLGIGEAIYVLDQVCRGLAAMHAAGLVHRDLKPANVLLGPAFRVALGDLGVSRVVEETEGDLEPWGTPAYMAPEVRFGLASDPNYATRTDVFSLAVLAYRVLTGRLPYERARVPGATPPIPASEINDALPPTIDPVLEKGLALLPEQRTAGADVFRRELVAALDAAAPPELEPARVVVADDDPEYRRITELVLQRAFPSSSIECVRDGKMALAAADRAWPDLVVTDLDMPGMDGRELIVALRSRPGGDTLPVMVVSAIAGSTNWPLLERLDADGFVGKPFEPGQLVALARGVLDRRGRSRPARSG